MYNGDRLQSSQHETFSTYTFIQSKCMQGSWRLLVTQGGFARWVSTNSYETTNNLRSSLTATLLHTCQMQHLNLLYWATLEDQLGFDRQHHVEGRPVHPYDQNVQPFSCTSLPIIYKYCSGTLLLCMPYREVPLADLHELSFCPQENSKFL
jgi:hypothetical protein